MGDFMRSITVESAHRKDRRKVDRGVSRRLSLAVAVAAVIGMVGFRAVTAPTAAQAAAPMSWELPDGVNRVGEVLSPLDAEGNTTGSGPAAPGRTFRYAFLLENSTDEAVTVTGFDSNFTIRMRPNRQADLPIDHCMEFIEIRDFGERQSFPVVIEPGEAVQINDNETDTDTDTDTDDGVGAGPGGTESESPEVGAAPTPPSRVETASASTSVRSAR